HWFPDRQLPIHAQPLPITGGVLTPDHPRSFRKSYSGRISDPVGAVIQIDSAPRPDKLPMTWLTLSESKNTGTLPGATRTAIPSPSANVSGRSTSYRSPFIKATVNGLKGARFLNARIVSVNISRSTDCLHNRYLKPSDYLVPHSIVAQRFNRVEFGRSPGRVKAEHYADENRYAERQKDRTDIHLGRQGRAREPAGEEHGFLRRQPLPQQRHREDGRESEDHAEDAADR